MFNNHMWHMLAFHNALLVLGMMALLWVASVYLRNVSIVDPFWSVGFLLVSLNTVREVGTQHSHLLWCVVLWSLRLFGYLIVRCWGKPEDARYTAFRKRFGEKRYVWFSFFQVFMLQGFLVWIISSVLVAGFVNHTPGWHHTLGLALWFVGWAWESVADAQLYSFKKNALHQNSILNTGLWRLSRHPNYFGECVLWWGFWVCTWGHSSAFYTVVSPLIMSYLLLKVSGVSLLDAHMLKHKPHYAEYIRTTPAFFPRLTAIFK
jgi:steroid 5-alpha reductase family enzyme